MTAHLQTYESSTRGSPPQAEDLAAERERIAAGLNDSVIHSLFAASLDLHGALALEASDQVHDRVRAALGELDRAITVVRTTVFDMAYPAAINDTPVAAQAPTRGTSTTPADAYPRQPDTRSEANAIPVFRHRGA